MHILRQPQILSEPIADVSEDRGCGVANGVRLATAGGARLALGRVTCETAAALALWMEHEVQPNAVRMLGTRVASVTHFGSYACRNIKGSPWLGAIRSEHATANAVDITGFVLADGRTVSILRDWPRDGAEARFLHAAHRGACRYFRGVLGPRYNDLHKDHFHLDRGAISHCR